VNKPKCVPSNFINCINSSRFYASIISEIEEIANHHGYFCIISSSGESIYKEVESVKNQ